MENILIFQGTNKNSKKVSEITKIYNSVYDTTIIYTDNNITNFLFWKELYF